LMACSARLWHGVKKETVHQDLQTRRAILN
jgi:hypothetical protein